MTTALETLERFVQLGRLTLSTEQLQALNVAMLGEVVKALKARRFVTKNFELITGLAITDTDNHDSPKQVDLYQSTEYSFFISNGCSQEMTFRILGLLTQGAAAAPIGDPLTVPANGMDCVSVDRSKLWQPWIGARVSFATAPTSGRVDVIMCRREEAWGQ